MGIRKRRQPSLGGSSSDASPALRRLRAEVESLRDFTYALTERIAALEATEVESLRDYTYALAERIAALEGTSASQSQMLALVRVLPTMEPPRGESGRGRGPPRMRRDSTVSMHGSSALSRPSSPESEAESA